MGIIDNILCKFSEKRRLERMGKRMGCGEEYTKLAVRLCLNKTDMEIGFGGRSF